jgi:hypothetical protein
MAVKKILTIEEQLEEIILTEVRKEIPDVVKNFVASMTNPDANSLDRGLEYFSDWLYDNFIDHICIAIEKWALDNLEVETTISLKLR